MNNVYDELTSRGAKKEEIEKELTSRGLPVDGWESSSISGIANNPEHIACFREELRGACTAATQAALDIWLSIAGKA